jgi:hypothetical protein
MEPFKMEFDLKEFSYILITGAFAFGSAYALILIWGWHPLKEINLDSDSLPKVFLIGGVATFVFAAGILAEDVSQRIAGGEGLDQAHPVFSWPLTTAKELRFRSFFIILNSQSCVMECRLRPVAKDLLALTNKMDELTSNCVTKLWSSLDPYHNKSVDDTFNLPTEDCPKSTDYEGLVNQVFYKTKNIVHGSHEYSHEMEMGEMRLNFSRSFLLICYIFGTLHLVNAILLLIFHKEFEVARCLARMKLDAHEDFFNIIALFLSRPGPWGKHFKIYLLVLALHLGGFFIGMKSYEVESDKYNVRIFGYYTTILSLKEDKPYTDQIQPRDKTEP